MTEFNNRMIAADTGFSSVQNRSYGKAGTVSAGYRPLFRFDLFYIPAGAKCLSATLRLTWADVNSRANNITLGIYKISDANGDWIEGSNGGGTALEGEPNWNYKFYSATNPIAWAGSDGLQTAGTDYIDTILASETVPYAHEIGDKITFTFNENGLEVLESMFGAETNNGLLLHIIAGVAGWTGNIAMKEHDNMAYRPALAITYDAPSLSAKPKSGGQVRRMN